MTSKAQRIREIAWGKPEANTTEIAAIIRHEFNGPCDTGYVRVVLRQRTAGGSSKADRRWQAKNPDKLRAIWCRANKRYREKKIPQYTEWRRQYNAEWARNRRERDRLRRAVRSLAENLSQ